VRPWSYELAGRFDEHVFTSEALRGNPLGDPHERPLWVYVPAGYDDEPDHRYPSVYVIQGFTGQLDMWRNRSPFGAKNFPELTDEVFAEGAPPCLVVWVDAWTSIGGSQFLDSPAIGRYHTYLCDEVVPWVDAHYRTLAEPGRRAIQGKSSGGYGAMVSALLRPGEDGSVRLPFDPDTGELVPEVWKRWLAWDPVRMARERPDAVRSWKAVYIDSGKSDEYFLDLGAEAFRRTVEEIGGPEVLFELFEGKHGGITYRYPKSLKWLAEQLNAPAP
jgi:S-formylglutathione hydrolase FrmB